MTSRGQGSFRLAARLGVDFVRSRPVMVAGYGALLVLQTFLQGIGLVLLVPILAVAGIGAEDSTTGTLAGPARFAFETLNLPESLPALLVIFVGLMALREVIGFVVNDISNQLQLRYTAGLRVRLFGAISRASWPFVAALRTSDTQHALQAEIGAVSSTVFGLLRSANTVLTIVAYGVVSVVIAPAFAPPILAIAAAVVVIARPFVKRARAHGATLLTAQRGAGAITYDHIEGMRDCHPNALSQNILLLHLR